MFCPNCGTENDDSATTCKKCGFNLKGAAAPKFKGTMLMMNAQAPRPGAPAPTGPAAPGPAPAGGVPGGPPNFGAPPAGTPGPGMPTGPRAQLKGTMLGVAPPSLGGQMPPQPQMPPQAGAVPAPAQPPPAAGFGAPPPAGAHGGPGFQGGAVNPLGGTMVADPAGGFNPYGQGGGGPYGAPPQGAPPVAPPPGFGAPPPANFGAPPPAGGFGAPPPHGGFGSPQGGGPPGGGFPPPGGGYGAPPPQGFGAPAGAPPAYQPPGLAPQQGFGGSSAPGYSAQGGGAMVAATGQRGPVGKTRNPVMVLLIGWLCFVYAFIEGAAMLKELRAFRGKQDINLLFFLIPILNLIEIWKLPAKVLEAKQMAGVPNPQVAHPILYLLLGIYFLPADLNEVWQAAGGGQQQR